MASDRVRFSDLPVGAEFSLGGWRGRKVGDGCVVCKPELARELAEPEPSPPELSIRELEELRKDFQRIRSDMNLMGWVDAAAGVLRAIYKIDARLAKLREVRP